MKTFFAVVGVALLIIILCILGAAFNAAGWFAGRSVEVVKQQIDPAELLRI